MQSREVREERLQANSCECVQHALQHVLLQIRVTYYGSAIKLAQPDRFLSDTTVISQEERNLQGRAQSPNRFLIVKLQAAVVARFSQS